MFMNSLLAAPTDPEDDEESEAEYIKITQPKAVRGKLYNQDYREITAKLLRTGTLFEDPMFKPCKFSISCTGKLLNGEDASKIRWIRAKDLFHDPKMLKHGHSKSDVNQGDCCDCWLCAAMTALSEKTVLFKAVVPPNQTFEDGNGYTGAFWFKFWRYGKIVEVVVDDYLPVTSENKLIFTSSKEVGEVWPSLLEKAYAKLQGSYFHLNGGFSTSAMVDFSGGFPEDILGVEKYSDDSLFNKLTELFMREGNSMVCAGTSKDPLNGLVGCHAYTVLGVLDEASGFPRLIKLRNPWGEQHYTGPWSRIWLETREKKKEVELLYKCSRDEFWMPMADFTKRFSKLYMCHDLGPEFYEKYATYVLTKKNKKIRFTLSLKTSSDSETFIAVSQEGRRRLRDELELENNAKLPIKLQIYHENSLMFDQKFQRMRNRNHRLILSPGDYCLIVEADYVDQVTEICLRVAAKCNKQDISLHSPMK